MRVGSTPRISKGIELELCCIPREHDKHSFPLSEASLSVASLVRMFLWVPYINDTIKMPAFSRIILSVSSLIVFAAVLLILTSPIGFHAYHYDFFSSDEESIPRAPRTNVWAELSYAEVDDIHQFLYNVPNDLNLTRNPSGSQWHNQIGLVEVLQPNKTGGTSLPR